MEQLINSETSQATCLLCCQDAEYFVLPNCNHKHICWKCCMNLIEKGQFQCPFCRKQVHSKEKVIFANLEQMVKYSYLEILKNCQLLKSEKNSNFYYTNEEVAQKIQYETSYFCPMSDCNEQFDGLNKLRKHLDLKHKKQFCQICLNHRKCVLSEQVLYSDIEYQKHIKSGELSQTGDLILFHPTCDFCKQSFYDIEMFRKHLNHTHEQCELCKARSSELGFIYYKDYEQAKVHFRKSHFLCQIGNCIMTKFQNVFATQEALQDHVMRIHKKSKKGQGVLNIQLGFNRKKQDQVYEWDKIGKNYLPLFQMVEKHEASKLYPVQHQDCQIDIRDFYNEQTKRNSKWDLKRIKKVIFDKEDYLGIKAKSLYIDDVQFFRPLEMTPLTRNQLEKFLSQIFDVKVSSQIINKFFQGRQDFGNVNDYFNFVKNKMKSSSLVAFYYAFPQLIRFFKNQNPNKQKMDQFYCQQLRQLEVKKMFIIHSKRTYSQILFLMNKFIEMEIMQRDSGPISDREINLEQYLKFLKEKDDKFYIQNQENLFFIPKDKMIFLYHMINKCRTKDFLKMNWLLKIGFSNDAYRILQKEFYYKIQNECQKSLKKLSVQELAYLYAYCTVCLEALHDKVLFQRKKQKPASFFFSEILTNNRKIDSASMLEKIMQLEIEYLNGQNVIKLHKNKGIIVNEVQHPSLLDLSIQVDSQKLKPPDKKQDFPALTSFGKVRPKVWAETKKPLKKQQQQDFPSLSPAVIQKQFAVQQQEEFPVYHFDIKKAKKQKKTMNLQQFHNQLGFSGNTLPNKWKQQTDISLNWQKRLQNEQKRIQRIEKSRNNGQSKNDKTEKQKQKQKQINKAQEQNKSVAQKKYQQQEPQEPMIYIGRGKKTTPLQQQSENSKDKKYNKKKNKKAQQDKGLFQIIEQEQKISKLTNFANHSVKGQNQVEKQRKKKKNKIRADITSSEQSEAQKKQQNKKQNKSKLQDQFTQSFVKNRQDLSLLQLSQPYEKKSKLNELIYEANKKNIQKQPEVKVKKNKKGKKVIIEKVDFWNLK